MGIQVTSNSEAAAVAQAQAAAQANAQKAAAPAKAAQRGTTSAATAPQVTPTSAASLTQKPGTSKTPLVLKSPAAGKPGASAAPGDVAGADSELKQANNTLARATSRYNADMTLLNQDQTRLAKQEARDQHPSGVLLRVEGDPNAGQTVADDQAVQNQEQVVAQALLAQQHAQSGVAAAQKTRETAGSYRVSAPGLTPTKLGRALGQVETAAVNNTKQKQAQVTDDTTTLGNTTAAVTREDNLVAQNPQFAGRTIGVLRPQLVALGQERTSLQRDSTALSTAQHNQNATGLAVGMVENSQQYGADLDRFNAQLKQLQTSGVLNSQGVLQSNLKLSGSQQVQVEQQLEELTATGDKLGVQGTDVTTFEQDLAGLRLDAAKYGSTTQGAVNSVNKVLSKLGLPTLSTPAAEPVSTARAGVRASTGAAQSADGQWDVDSRAAAVSAQQQRVSTLLGKLKSDPSEAGALQGALQKQDQILEQDEGSYGQAVSYQGKTHETAALAKDGRAVAAAQASFNADPSSANWNALQKAQGLQAQDNEQLSVDEKGLYAASAQVDAAQQLSQQEVGGQLQRALFTQENPGLSADAPANLKLLSTANSAQSAAAAAGTSGAAQSFDYWNSAADQQAKLDQNWELNELTSGVPVSSATQLSGLINGAVDGAWGSSEAAAAAPQAPGGRLTGAALQEDKTTLAWQLPLARAEFGQAQFNETQPADLLDPQLQSVPGNPAQAQSGESQAWQSYAKQQGLTVTDPTTMASLNDLGAGQVVDTTASAEELGADQNEATRVSASRPLSEQFFDLLSGQNPTAAWNRMLTGTQGELTRLSGSAAQQNLQYEQLAGTVSGSDARFAQNATGNVHAWQLGQNVVTGVIEGGVMMVDPLVGGITALVLKQGLATADNYLTATEGGQVSDDGEVTPEAAFTNNFGTGNDGTDEKQQALVDAGSDVLSTAGMVAGAGVAGAVTARLGSAGLEQVGAAGLSKLAQQEAMQTLGGRLVSTGVNWGTFGLVSGVANDGGTAAQALLAVAQGKQTRGQALSQIGDSLEGTVLGAGALALFAPAGQALGEAVFSAGSAGVRSLAGAVGRGAVDPTEGRFAASAVDAVDSGWGDLGEPTAVPGELTEPAAGSDVSGSAQSAAARAANAQIKVGQFASLLAGNFGPALASGHVSAADLAADIGNTVAGSAADGLHAAGHSEAGEAGQTEPGNLTQTPSDATAPEGVPESSSLATNDQGLAGDDLASTLAQDDTLTQQNDLTEDNGRDTATNDPAAAYRRAPRAASPAEVQAAIENAIGGAFPSLAKPAVSSVEHDAIQAALAGGTDPVPEPRSLSAASGQELTPEKVAQVQQGIANLARGATPEGLQLTEDQQGQTRAQIDSLLSGSQGPDFAGPEAQAAADGSDPQNEAPGIGSAPESTAQPSSIRYASRSETPSSGSPGAAAAPDTAAATGVPPDAGAAPDTAAATGVPPDTGAAPESTAQPSSIRYASRSATPSSGPPGAAAAPDTTTSATGVPPGAGAAPDTTAAAGVPPDTGAAPDAGATAGAGAVGSNTPETQAGSGAGSALPPIPPTPPLASGAGAPGDGEGEGEGEGNENAKEGDPATSDANAAIPRPPAPQMEQMRQGIASLGNGVLQPATEVTELTPDQVAGSNSFLSGLSPDLQGASALDGGVTSEAQGNKGAATSWQDLLGNALSNREANRGKAAVTPPSSADVTAALNKYIASTAAGPEAQPSSPPGEATTPAEETPAKPSNEGPKATAEPTPAESGQRRTVRRARVKTDVPRGDVWGVASLRAAENGSDIANLPRFGGSRSDRSAFKQVQKVLKNANFDPQVISQLKNHLDSMSSYGGRAVAAVIAGSSAWGIEGFSSDELHSIGRFAGNVSSEQDGEFGAQLLAQLARVPGEPRSQLLGQDEAQYSALRQYLGTRAGEANPARDVAEVAFLASLDPADRSTAMSVLNGRRQAEAAIASSGPLSDDDKTAANTLQQIARQNNAPVQLLDALRGPRSFADPLEVVAAGSPYSAGTRRNPSVEYEAAGAELYGQMDAHYQQHAVDGTMPDGATPFNLTIGIGKAEGALNAAGDAAPSVYGSWGSLDSGYGFQSLSSKAASGLRLTIVADDDMTAKAIQSAHDKLTATWDKDGNIIKRNDSITIVSVESNPVSVENADAFVSLGRSSLLDDAVAQPRTTTYAITDGTERGSPVSTTGVDHELVAPDLNTGAALLVGHSLRAADEISHMLPPYRAAAGLKAIVGAGAVFDDSRFAPGLPAYSNPEDPSNPAATAETATAAESPATVHTLTPDDVLQAHVGNRYSLAYAFQENPKATDGAAPESPNDWRDYLAANYSHEVASTHADDGLRTWQDTMQLARPPTTLASKFKVRSIEFGMASPAEKAKIRVLGSAYALAMGAMVMSDLDPHLLPRAYPLLAGLTLLPERVQSWQRLIRWGRTGVFTSDRFKLTPGTDPISANKYQRFLTTANFFRLVGIPTDMLTIFSSAFSHPWDVTGSLDNVGHMLIGTGVGAWYYTILHQTANSRLTESGKYSADPFASQSRKDGAENHVVFTLGSSLVATAAALQMPPLIDAIPSFMAEGGWAIVSATDTIDALEKDPNANWYKKLQFWTSVLAHSGTGSQSALLFTWEGLLGKNFNP